MKKAMLSLYLFLSLSVSTVHAQSFASIAEAYPNAVTKSVEALPSGCSLWKDPVPSDMDKYWRCISKQRNIYLKASREKDYITAAIFAPWSSMEAWSFFHAAESIIHGKKSWQLKKKDIALAMEYIESSFKCCDKAISVNIGKRESQRCRREGKKIKKYLKQCLMDLDR